MIKAVVFDLYETLITIFEQKPYYSAQMAIDANVPLEEFRRYWRAYEHERTVGTCTLADALHGTLQSLNI